MGTTGYRAFRRRWSPLFLLVRPSSSDVTRFSFRPGFFSLSPSSRSVSVFRLLVVETVISHHITLATDVIFVSCLFCFYHL
ncbi:hypothetical protein QBC47DRAFT_198257 [Echria macrotheca]|uniref:Uncharacterized protein n=1 Tax=Echria macrotheca TaxID=438768 RepID=A0AAJ0FBX6_9PEZI|nr:hypothetical protein QBC47DRAFT_198257 [Echria macrotheca]